METFGGSCYDAPTAWQGSAQASEYRPPAAAVRKVGTDFESQLTLDAWPRQWCPPAGGLGVPCSRRIRRED